MKRAVFFQIVLCVLLANPAHASITTIELGCTGNYPNGTSWSTELNLSQQFSSINSISIEWSGSVTSETYTAIGDNTPSLVLPGAFIAYIYKTDSYVGAAQAVSSQSQSTLLFNNPLEPFDETTAFTIFDGNSQRLLEGPVTLNIHPTGIGTILAIFAPYDKADGVINSARLLVNGTTIAPEPATLALLGLGGLLMRRK